MLFTAGRLGLARTRHVLTITCYYLLGLYELPYPMLLLAGVLSGLSSRPMQIHASPQSTLLELMQLAPTERQNKKRIIQDLLKHMCIATTTTPNTPATEPERTGQLPTKSTKVQEACVSRTRTASPCDARTNRNRN